MVLEKTAYVGSALSARAVASAFLAIFVITIASGVVAAAPAQALPRSFFGVVPQSPLEARDFALMRGVVGTVRISIGWSQVEPRPGQYEFAELDETIVRAAAAGIRVMPFVSSTPSWLTHDPERPPLFSARARRGWSAFLARLVRRYGPGGTVWADAGRAMPIRQWQIWNEPNFLLAWHPKPAPRGYARLLRLSAWAIRAVDDRAEIVAAGVAPITAGMSPWVFLQRFYEVPGVRGSFDVAAVHPYAPTVADVILQVRITRRVMALAGDHRKPLLVTELGVASSSSIPSTYDRGLFGQATFLRRVFELLIRERDRWRIRGVDWFSWRDYPAADVHCVFCQYAGLFDLDARPKPAWWAFRRLALRGAAVR